MGLLSSIGGLVGLAMGGPAGAAIGAGLGKGAEGGNLKDILSSGAKGFLGGNLLNQGIAAAGTGFSGGQGSLASMFSGGAQGGNQGIGNLMGRMSGGGGNMMPMGQGQGNFNMAQMMGGGGGGIMNTMRQNPLITSLMMAAYDENRYPDGVKILTPLQQRQIDTGERLPDYKGTMAPQIRYAAKGGLIEGPGTGTSDSIPATIYQNGSPVQEAALSDGEFVLREKDVQAVGDGDREKGAARLYALQREFDKGAA
mgnify:CR=1 FL=1